MMRRFGGLAAAMVAAAVWLEASTGVADERTDARREFREGMALVADGHYDEGIAHLQDAYAILPHPNVLYNIALAHMYAGRAEVALEYFHRYEQEAPVNEAQEVQLLMATLRRAIAPTVEKSVEEPKRVAEPVLEKGAPQPAPASPQSTPPPSKTAAAVPALPPTKAAQGVYEEEVVSASRFAQSPLDAPNATSIITSQDIRMTGLTNMTDLLRRVAGMEVSSVTPNHAEVSIRGLNRRQSNKVLVLLDGRPLRQDFMATNWFEAIPISIEDVERIEIIRGPASALYGADAFSGVISIISKAPGAGDNFLVASGGNKGQARAVSSFRGQLDDLSYRFGFGYKQAYNAVAAVADDRVDSEPTVESPQYANRQAWANGEARYRIAKKSIATVGGNVGYGDYTLLGLSRAGQINAPASLRSNTYASLTTPLGVRVTSFWDHMEGSSVLSVVAPGGREQSTAQVKQEVADADLSWTGMLKVLIRHNLTLGGNYRFKSIRWGWLDDTHTQHHFGAYLQDVMQLANPLRLQFGARIDRHPLLDSLQFSPRGSLVYRFVRDQSLRISAGRAFRGPSFVESYIQVAVPTDVRGVSAFSSGNDKLDPESITSYEIGYQNQASDYFALEVNGYFNMVKDAIVFTDAASFRLRDVTAPDDVGAYQSGIDAFPLGSLRFTNERASFRQLGGELGARFYPLKGMDVYSNYAIHDTRPFNAHEKEKLDPGRAREQQTSRHKINTGVQYRAAFGLDLSLDMSWVSKQVWIEQVTDMNRGVTFQTLDQPSFLMLHGRIGYRLLNDRVELAVVATNLAFTHKRQHPYGQPLDTRVLGSAKVRF